MTNDSASRLHSMFSLNREGLQEYACRNPDVYSGGFLRFVSSFTLTLYPLPLALKCFWHGDFRHGSFLHQLFFPFADF